MNAPTVRTGPAHNPGLDVVRAAAILLVLYSHAADWFVGDDQAATIRATYLGAVGVELFFALSGFLIGGILMRVRDAGLTPASLGNFWVRRWARTLPAYYVVFGGLCWFFGVWTWPTFAFAQNFFPFSRWAPLSPHSWSLVLEEWFYLLFPLFLLPLGRLRHAVPLVCLGLIAGCTTAQALALHGVLAVPGDYNINPVLRLDAPAWGVLAAWQVRRQPPGRWASLLCLALGLLATAAQAWAFSLVFDGPRRAAWHFEVWGPTYLTLRVTATSLGLALVVAGARGCLRKPVPLVTPIAFRVAALSYAIYLVHVPVIFLAKSYLTGLGDGWPYRLAVAGLVIAASLLLRYGVERPFLALRERLAPAGEPGQDTKFGATRTARTFPSRSSVTVSGSPTQRPVNATFNDPS